MDHYKNSSNRLLRRFFEKIWYSSSCFNKTVSLRHDLSVCEISRRGVLSREKHLELLYMNIHFVNDGGYGIINRFTLVTKEFIWLAWQPHEYTCGNFIYALPRLLLLIVLVSTSLPCLRNKIVSHGSLAIGCKLVLHFAFSPWTAAQSILHSN